MSNLLQLQLDQVRADVRRARSLFGQSPVSPPANIGPDEAVVRRWVEGACPPTLPSGPNVPSYGPPREPGAAPVPLPAPPGHYPPDWRPGVEKDKGPVASPTYPGCR